MTGSIGSYFTEDGVYKGVFEANGVTKSIELTKTEFDKLKKIGESVYSKEISESDYYSYFGEFKDSNTSLKYTNFSMYGLLTLGVLLFIVGAFNANPLLLIFEIIIEIFD